MVEVFSNATARPSTFPGADSNQPSTAFFQNVNKLLTGDESAQKAVSQAERQNESCGKTLTEVILEENGEGLRRAQSSRFRGEPTKGESCRQLPKW
jgi:hypothetical protein